MCALFCIGHVFEDRNLTIIWLDKQDVFQFSKLEFLGKKNVLAMDLAENDVLFFSKVFTDLFGKS